MAGDHVKKAGLQKPSQFWRRLGVSTIEGLAFLFRSVADGPVIEEAGLRLAHGTTTEVWYRQSST